MRNTSCFPKLCRVLIGALKLLKLVDIASFIVSHAIHLSLSLMIVMEGGVGSEVKFMLITSQ